MNKPKFQELGPDEKIRETDEFRLRTRDQWAPACGFKGKTPKFFAKDKIQFRRKIAE